MKVLYLFLAILLFSVSVFSQDTNERGCTDNARRLGPAAEANRFIYIPGNNGLGYYEVVSKHVAAYLNCGKKVNIHKDEVIKIGPDLYKGSYDGYSGIWGETLVDFDGVGPDASSVIYILLDDLKKLPGKPNDQKKLFTERVENTLIQANLKNQFIPFLAASLVIIVSLILAVRSFIGRSVGKNQMKYSSGAPSGGGWSPHSSSAASEEGDWYLNTLKEHEIKQQKIREKEAEIMFAKIHDRDPDQIDRLKRDLNDLL